MPSYTMLATLDANGEEIQRTRILSDIAERYAREMPSQYKIIKPVTIVVNPPKQEAAKPCVGCGK